MSIRHDGTYASLACTNEHSQGSSSLHPAGSGHPLRISWVPLHLIRPTRDLVDDLMLPFRAGSRRSRLGTGRVVRLPRSLAALLGLTRLRREWTQGRRSERARDAAFLAPCTGISRVTLGVSRDFEPSVNSLPWSYDTLWLEGSAEMRRGNSPATIACPQIDRTIDRIWIVGWTRRRALGP